MNKKEAIRLLKELNGAATCEEQEAIEYVLKVLKGQKSKAANGKASKEKGKVGEREWSAKCKEQGYDTHRGQQFCGLNGDADVIGLPGIHQEVKRVEKLNLYDAIEQSIRDAKENEIPIVAHRKNSCDWLVSMRAQDWFKLYKEWEVGANEQNQEKAARSQSSKAK
jgi:hypothetical protein